MSELVTALRHCAKRGVCNGCPRCGKHITNCPTELYREAADAIEELSRKVENLEALREISPEAEYAIDKHADNLISHMEELISGLKDKPRWIPVTERLPEEGEFVLVYGDLYPNKYDGGVIAVSKRMDWNYWKGFGREKNITHWMPLPSTEGLDET